MKQTKTSAAAEDRRTIQALVRVGEAIASRADYEQALASLIETISEQLDVETGGFMLYDREQRQLVLQHPGFGIWDQRLIEKYHVPANGRSNAAQVFRSRRHYLSNNAREDPRLVRRFVELFHAENVLSVPLVVEDEAIGVFHTINKRGGPFTPADVDLLMLLAPMLAVSIQSAQMFREVRAQRVQLERAIFLQSELSRTAFEAPGMEPLADRLSHLLNRPVMVLDPDLVTLASARWPADNPPDPSWAAGSAPRGQPGPALTPIAVGNHFGGYVAVLEEHEGLDVIDARAVEHAATIFALEMLREQTAYEVEARLKGDVLAELVAGRFADEAEAAQLLSRLGQGVSGAFRVARLDVTGAPAAQAPARAAQRHPEMLRPGSRLYGRLSEACRAVLGTESVAPWRSGFLVLVRVDPDRPEQGPALATDLVEHLLAAPELAAPTTRLYVALGRVARSGLELASSLETAERALALARRLGVDRRPFLFDHLGVYRLLFGPNEARDRRDFVDETLGRLIDYDAGHRSGLVETLRALAGADYNVTEAARRLHVHTNTLKYRLKRIESLVGGDPSRGDLRLQAELALKILDVPRAAAAEGAG